MNIAIIGAGVVGVTTAYELARQGHQVTVVERRESVAAESSFANAGLLSAGGVSPAAARGLRPWLLRGLWARESALRWEPVTALSARHWMLRWWRACAQPHDEPVRAMVGLAHASLARLQELGEDHGLAYERSAGVLLVMRHEQEFLPTRRHVEMLRELGVPALEVSADRARELEPGLAGSGALAGGVYLPDDGVGNCRQFTQQLREVCERTFGVRFRFNQQVQTLERRADLWRLTLSPSHADATGAASLLLADAVVLCTGAHGVDLVPGLARRVRLWPVEGWSLSFPLRPDRAGPRSALVDVGRGVTLSRLGSRLRVTGGYLLARPARPGAAPPPIEEADLAPLARSLEHWFPGSVDRSQAQVWRGARPMLPDGPPLIGPAGPPGLWLNLGHGAHGWTLACGAAQLLARQVGDTAGRPVTSPGVDPHPFQLV